MARPQNRETHLAHREKLLEVGERRIRATSYTECGINQVLAEAGVPKGSFYHHFPTKEAFGIEVARRYHATQAAFARACLADPDATPLDRLRGFFTAAREDMAARGYGEGCLMCNLSTELADERPAFQAELDLHWQAMVAELTPSLREIDLGDIGLAHLTPEEAGDWLMNAWSGALTRMKASASAAPLDLFMRAIFKPKDLTP